MNPEGKEASEPSKFLMFSEPDITALLQVWTGGDKAALDALMPWILGELKKIAHAYLASEPHGRTLQTTAGKRVLSAPGQGAAAQLG